MEVLKFFGLLSLIWYFVEGAKPIQFLKKILKVHPDSKPKDLTRQIIAKLLSCALCSGFWIGILYYFELIPTFLLIACLVGVCAEVFYRILKFIFNNLLGQL